MNDMQLLEDYAVRNSQEAFTALVQRHLNLVYSVALRCVGDPHQAQDVAQSVFLLLAQKASRLHKNTVLTGWLYQTARLTSARVRRGELRRQRREQEAFMQSPLDVSTSEAPWEKLAPVLDEALGRLGQSERNAILLRYFEDRSVSEVALALGLKEPAVKKRLVRALNKLRSLFAKRGITVSAGALAAAIAANSLQAAPPALAASVAAACSAPILTTTAALAATKALTMTTLQKAMVTATIAVLASAGIYEAHQAAQLRDQVRTLQQQQAPWTEQLQRLQSGFANATNRLADLQAENARLNAKMPQQELLQLRGDVTRLHNDSKELSQLKSQQAKAKHELFELSMNELKRSMTNGAAERVEKMKSRLGLSGPQADAIKTALFAKAESMIQIYKAGESGSLTGQEQHDQFQKLEADTEQAVKGVLNQSQLTALEQMNNEQAIAFAKSWGDREAANIARLCKITTEQQAATASIIASLPAEQGGPASLATGNSSPDARQRLEGRLRALETVLTPEQLEKYRQERLQEIERYEVGLRAFGVANPTKP